MRNLSYNKTSGITEKLAPPGARRPSEELRRTQEQLHSLAQRLMNAAELERKALTRELHDRVGHSLTALNLTLARIANELPPDAPDRTREGIAEALELVVTATECTDDVMADLRSPALEERGLLAALHSYSRQFRRRTGINVLVSGLEPAPRLPGAVEVTLFRIAQEALTNAAKHARTRQARIEVRLDNEAVTMTVVDDGAGFTAAARGENPPRWGILSMSERAQAVGGTLSIKSRLLAGTSVVVRVPLRA